MIPYMGKDELKGRINNDAEKISSLIGKTDIESYAPTAFIYTIKGEERVVLLTPMPDIPEGKEDKEKLFSRLGKAVVSLDPDLTPVAIIFSCESYMRTLKDKEDRAPYPLSKDPASEEVITVIGLTSQGASGLGVLRLKKDRGYLSVLSKEETTMSEKPGSMQAPFLEAFFDGWVDAKMENSKLDEPTDQWKAMG